MTFKDTKNKLYAVISFNNKKTFSSEFNYEANRFDFIRLDNIEESFLMMN